MSLGRVLRTASRIPAAQLAARARFMVRRRLYAARPEAPIAAAARAAAGTTAAEPLPRLPLELVAPGGIAAARARAAAFAAGRFEHLHHVEDFSAGVRWKAAGTSPLWRYQLQYLGAVLDMALAGDAAGARRLLDSWGAGFGSRWDKEAWHPYPASLRLGNLCHAAAALGGFDALGPGALALAATHAAFVLDHIEHDVRGNHILENVRALLVAAAFLRGPLADRCATAALPILEAELREQVLADGGHFEMSPMYHSIVLWRLLEIDALAGAGAPAVRAAVVPAITQMRRFLAGVLCPDGEIPLLGDSARGFAPPAADLLGDGNDAHGAQSARGVHGAAPQGHRAFPESGLHVFRGDGVWAIFDTGPVCPGYLPAHGQADSLTVEAWFGGRRIVGDPGVCEYTGPERAWGRSSRAHSTVTIDDRDTSEVYASFRVGGRATIDRVMTRRERDEVTAVMTPWPGDARFTRIVAFGDETRTSLRIVDDGVVPLGRTARSRLHLAPGVRIIEGGDGSTELTVSDDVVAVHITAAHPVHIEAGRSSPEFGLIVPTTILVQGLSREGSRSDVHGLWVLKPRGPAKPDPIQPDDLHRAARLPPSPDGRPR